MALIVAKKSENEVEKVVGGRMMGEWVAGGRGGGAGMDRK